VWRNPDPQSVIECECVAEGEGEKIHRSMKGTRFQSTAPMATPTRRDVRRRLTMLQ
jgi:hypothetical protein